MEHKSGEGNEEVNERMSRNFESEMLVNVLWSHFFPYGLTSYRCSFSSSSILILAQVHMQIVLSLYLRIELYDNSSLHVVYVQYELR